MHVSSLALRGGRASPTHKTGVRVPPDGPLTTADGHAPSEPPLLNDCRRRATKCDTGTSQTVGEPVVPRPERRFTRRDKVSVKLDVPKPAYKLVFAPDAQRRRPRPKSLCLSLFVRRCVHHSTKDQVGCCWSMLDTAGAVRAEQLTLLPPGGGPPV